MAQQEPLEEDIDMMDEIEVAKYRRMATDALTGNFAIHIYGGQSQTEVLAHALERCVDEIAHLTNIIDTKLAADDDEELDDVAGEFELSDTIEKLAEANETIAKIRMLVAPKPEEGLA
jgi:hypothetical protein